MASDRLRALVLRQVTAIVDHPSYPSVKEQYMLARGDAVFLCELLERAHIRYWVMGGWGVDALLGRETRPHKDLDLLLVLGDVPKLWHLFYEHRFTQKWVWRENRWVDVAGDRRPTAFVVADKHGREIDVHIIDIGPDGTIIQQYDDPWPFSASLRSISGEGRIGGAVIPCVSAATQLAMHTGYPLPDEHKRDVELLQLTNEVGSG